MLLLIGSNKGIPAQYGYISKICNYILADMFNDRY